MLGLLFLEGEHTGNLDERLFSGKGGVLDRDL